MAVLLGAWAFWWEPRSLVTREVSTALPCWRGAPLRIAVISDLHAGAPYIDEAKVRRVVELTNAGHPDIIVLLGDYVVQGVAGGHFVSPELTASRLSSLRAPLGTFAILGNHDGWLDTRRVANAVRSSGIAVIDDDAVRVRDFWLAGVSDLWTSRHDIPAALSKVTDGAPAILIMHNPDLFPNVPARICLTLAGHTHGGQVALPLLGRLIVPSRYGERFAIGHIVESGRHMYVTSGIGTSIIPVRFRVPPEIVFLTVRPTATNRTSADLSP